LSTTGVVEEEEGGLGRGVKGLVFSWVGVGVGREVLELGAGDSEPFSLSSPASGWRKRRTDQFKAFD